MASLLIATEDPHILLHRLFNSSFQTLGSIKDRISQILTYIICSKSSNKYLIDTGTYRNYELFPAFEDLISAIGSESQQKTQDLPSPGRNSQSQGEPEVVFNVLDSILKCSLERLKLMRESMSWRHVDHSNYNLKAVYTQHIDTIRSLSLEGKLGVAICLQNKMIHKGLLPDVITYNHLINGFCKIGAFEKAEQLVQQMKVWGPLPNVVTYNTLMKGYCAFHDTDKADDVMLKMTYDNIKANIVTNSIMLHDLCKKGRLEVARVILLRLTDEYGEKTLIPSTTLMDSYFKKGDTYLAFKLWKEILSKKVDVTAYNVIINGSCLRWDLIIAYKFVNQMLKNGFLPDIFTYNILINAFCKMKRIEDAFYIYKVMQKMGVNPDKITYNILIQGLCKVEDMETAHELLNSMLEKSMVPPLLTWNLIIDGYGRQGDKENATYIKDKMIKYGIVPNVYTWNALIHMHIKREERSEAKSVIKEIISPDTVTMNLMVGAESEFGHLYSALDVYEDMKKRGCEPDVITYTQLIKGFCRRCKVEFAERIFSDDMLKNENLVVDQFPFQILMKKYFKMGNLDGAYRVYQKWLSIFQGK